MEPSDPQRAWRPQCYDPLEQHTVVWRKLPHWSQSGALTFITWRTWDSMPAAVVRGWLAERDDWLRRQGVDPSQPDWECLLRDWPVAQRQALRRFVSDRWGQHLDELHGSCPLRRPEFAAIVAESLRHFDGNRYVVSDFVVMPNHVHLLAAFPTEEALLAQCESWKHYTGRAQAQPGAGPFRAVLGAGRLRPSGALARGVRESASLPCAEPDDCPPFPRRVSALQLLYSSRSVVRNSHHGGA